MGKVNFFSITVVNLFNSVVKISVETCSFCSVCYFSKCFSFGEDVCVICKQTDCKDFHRALKYTQGYPKAMTYLYTVIVFSSENSYTIKYFTSRNEAQSLTYFVVAHS